MLLLLGKAIVTQNKEKIFFYSTIRWLGKHFIETSTSPPWLDNGTSNNRVFGQSSLDCTYAKNDNFVFWTFKNKLQKYLRYWYVFQWKALLNWAAYFWKWLFVSFSKQLMKIWYISCIFSSSFLNPLLSSSKNPSTWKTVRTAFRSPPPTSPPPQQLSLSPFFLPLRSHWKHNAPSVLLLLRATPHGNRLIAWEKLPLQHTLKRRWRKKLDFNLFSPSLAITPFLVRSCFLVSCLCKGFFPSSLWEFYPPEEGQERRTCQARSRRAHTQVLNFAGGGAFSLLNSFIYFIATVSVRTLLIGIFIHRDRGFWFDFSKPFTINKKDNRVFFLLLTIDIVVVVSVAAHAHKHTSAP